LFFVEQKRYERKYIALTNLVNMWLDE